MYSIYLITHILNRFSHVVYPITGLHVKIKYYGVLAQGKQGNCMMVKPMFFLHRANEACYATEHGLCRATMRTPNFQFSKTSDLDFYFISFRSKHAQKINKPTFAFPSKYPFYNSPFKNERL